MRSEHVRLAVWQGFVALAFLIMSTTVDGWLRTLDCVVAFVFGHLCSKEAGKATKP